MHSRDVPIKDTQATLAEALLSVGVKMHKLPPEALVVARSSGSPVGTCIYFVMTDRRCRVPRFSSEV